MELLILVGAVCFAALLGLAITGYLQQRRAGSIVAVRVETRARR
ncbi:MAG TPA: hypothetical protein VH741_00130 [Candidatus Limnocylindrales bacterium]|jgi:hypothetical protein